MSKVSIDGFVRAASTDEKISKNLAALFSSDLGKEVLRYLRSITIESVSGANISDAELRHLEGQPYLVGLIERRIKHAEKVKSNE